MALLLQMYCFDDFRQVLAFFVSILCVFVVVLVSVGVLGGQTFPFSASGMPL